MVFNVCMALGIWPWELLEQPKHIRAYLFEAYKQREKNRWQGFE